MKIVELHNNNNNNNKLHLYRAFSKGYKAQKKNKTTTKKKNSEMYMRWGRDLALKIWCIGLYFSYQNIVLINQETKIIFIIKISESVQL